MESESSKEVASGSFKLLDILHHFTSGMKAIATDMVYVGADELRQCCGGAGFLLSSGIAD
jgi:acyl-CoA oxidase